jgi:cell division protein FtsW
MPFPARLKTPLQMDPVLLSIGLTLLIGGLLILASASISVSDNAVGDPFYYVQRQAIAALIGGASAFLCLFIPMSVWRNLGPLLLLIGLALLLVVLIPAGSGSVP